VVHRRVEVGVVAHLRRHEQLRLGLRHEDRAARLAVERVGDAPARSASLTACRSAVTCTRPVAMSPLSDGSAHASAAGVSLTSFIIPSAKHAARSSTWSPMATPTRGISAVPARRNTPNGRFCTGKSVAGSWALSTQLTSDGSFASVMRQ
jgi:hypothetical protein